MRPRSLGPPRKPPGRRGAGGRAGFPTRSFGQSGRWEPAGRGQEKVGRRLGSCPQRLSVSHSGDRRFPGSATATGTCQRGSLKLPRKFPSKGSLRGARVSPLPEPPRASRGLSSWQPPPPDWTGLDSLGVPPALALPLPLPPLLGRLGLVTSASGKIGCGGGGGRSHLPSQSRRRG